jgi:hypothetical protein
LAPDFLAAFLPDFLADFFADFLADFLPDFFADFLADFFADFLADFFAPVFLALDFFAVDFLAVDFFADDFFAEVFLADDFLAAFFAVAITFLLDQVTKEPPAFDASSASGYSSPWTAQEGRPSTMNRVAGWQRSLSPLCEPANLDLSHADATARDGIYSHVSAPPVW